MWPFPAKRSFKDVNTDLGNHILRDFKSEGWKVTSEYSDQMFDKGIDFDAYSLKRDGVKIEFEWDNWEDWIITGPAEVMSELAQRYSLGNQKETEQSSRHVPK